MLGNSAYAGRRAPIAKRSRLTLVAVRVRTAAAPSVAAGTHAAVLVKDIVPGAEGSSPSGFTAVGSTPALDR